LEGKPIAITIPPGEIVLVLNGPRLDDRRMLDVRWGNRALMMFAEDIQQRGDEIRPQPSSTKSIDGSMAVRISR
jgi:hypothetical protein